MLYVKSKDIEDFELNSMKITTKRIQKTTKNSKLYSAGIEFQSLNSLTLLPLCMRPKYIEYRIRPIQYKTRHRDTCKKENGAHTAYSVFKSLQTSSLILIRFPS